MRRRHLSELAGAVEGTVRGEDVIVSAAVVDSRAAGSDALFVAVHGQLRDGHAFVSDAFANGSPAAMIDEPWPALSSPEGALLVVGDTEEGLLRLATDERGAMSAKVVAVTGANGKTSTKDLAAAVLGSRFRTHASPASFNNEVGVPLTILGAPADTEVLICELGARRVGDHLRLCAVVSPDVVVVTNAGVAHMEIFGSWSSIVEATAEPIEVLEPAHTAVLNADDAVVAGLAARTRARVMTFGTIASADVRAEDVSLTPDGRPAFTLAMGGDREPVELAVHGEHMVPNALAAAACGLALGMSVAECATGLKGAGVSHWRMETFTTSGGVTVVNDAYNANPDSMAAGLRTARWIARGTRLIAVLGHMAELGPIALEEHERIGELLARIGVERLVAVGPEAEPIARAAVREGLEPDAVTVAATVNEALAGLRGAVRSGDVVFLKGSRVAGLERIAEAMR